MDRSSIGTTSNCMRILADGKAGNLASLRAVREPRAICDILLKSLAIPNLYSSIMGPCGEKQVVCTHLQKVS